MPQRPEYYKDFVMQKLKIGDTFTVIGDLYNYLHQRLGRPSERTVVRFHQNHVLTVDENGINETFRYFDLYKILRNGGMVDDE